MRIRFLLLVVLTVGLSLQGSANTTKTESVMDTLPFYEIPTAPENFTPGTVAARMVDGLGFRYYWATEGLRAEDLGYEPGNDGQSCGEVVEHVLGLSRFILRTVKREVHDNKREYLVFNK